MEASTEELDVSKDLSSPVFFKGKRTKRFRPHSPLVAPQFASSSSSSSDKESTTTSEVDTARCLILLSQGYHERHTSNAIVAAPSAPVGGGALFTCKTCGRSFTSFQALGGHRASHSKPKNDRRSMMFSDEDDYFPNDDHHNHPTSLALQLSNNIPSATAVPLKARMHECSYCGAEFTSGQALGGHMRKHRGNNVLITRPSSSIVANTMSIEELEFMESKKPRIGLSLDLNIPF